MATTLDTERIGDRMILKSAYHSIEFDSRLAEKKYPFTIGLHHAKFNDKIINELESSKIVKVDTDFNYYSLRLNTSSLYIIPQPLFDLKKFADVIYTLLQKLDDEIENT